MQQTLAVPGYILGPELPSAQASMTNNTTIDNLRSWFGMRESDPSSSRNLLFSPVGHGPTRGYIMICIQIHTSSHI